MEPPSAQEPTGNETDYSTALAAFAAPSPVVEYLVVVDPEEQELGTVGVVAAIDRDPGDLSVLASEPEDVEYFTSGSVLKSETHPWWGAFDHQYRTQSGRTGRLYIAFPFTPTAVDALASGLSFGVAERSAVEADEEAPTVIIPVDTDWWTQTAAEWKASGAAGFTPT